MQKKHFFKAVLFGCCAAMVITTGCGKKSNVIARVGNTSITTEEFQARINQFPAGSKEFFSQKENKIRLLDQLVDEEVLYQQAKKLNIDNLKDYKDQMKNAERQILISLLIRDQVDKASQVTEDDVKQYYTGNPVEFAEAERRNISHILVKTPEEAKAVLAELRDGQYKNFKQVAKQYSVDPSKENGGEIGWITKEQVVPEFANAAFALVGKGSVSDIIKTQFGYHIIRLNDKSMRPKIEFAQAHDQIQQRLIASKRQKLFKDMLDKAKEKIAVKRDNEKLQ